MRISCVVLVFHCAAVLARDVLRDDEGMILFAYYRQNNYQKKEVVKENVERVSWPELQYQIFDSSNNVSVVRYDIEKEVNLTIAIGEGGGYLFTQSINDVSILDGTDRTFNLNSLVAVPSGGICLSLAFRDEKTSLLVVHSSKPLSQDERCQPGTNLTLRIGVSALHNNNIKYVPSNQGKCDSPIYGAGGAEDYDLVDGPKIPPLGTHYHTRGAIYYLVNGSGSFDTGVEPLYSGELRFVNSGYYYGPEFFYNGSHVISVHDPDPAWVIFDEMKLKENVYNSTLCPIACYDNVSGTTDTPLRCVLPPPTATDRSSLKENGIIKNENPPFSMSSSYNIGFFARTYGSVVSAFSSYFHFSH